MTNVNQNSVSPVKAQNSVRDIKAQNLVRPIKRPATRHPIYDSPKPTPPNALVVILGIVFWPIALAFLIGSKTLGDTRKG